MIARKNRLVFSVVCLLETHTDHKQSQTCRKRRTFSLSMGFSGSFFISSWVTLDSTAMVIFGCGYYTRVTAKGKVLSNERHYCSCTAQFVFVCGRLMMTWNQRGPI